LISDINSRSDDKKKKTLGRDIHKSKKKSFKENDFNQTKKFDAGNKSREVNGEVKECNQNKIKSVPNSELQYQSFSRENDTELWASKN
jgi:Flp pilus assembly secretin CpaC